MSDPRDAQVFSAGGHCFTWAEVIDAARVRGDWATLQRHALCLRARESDLEVTGGLPTAAQVRVAGNEFRHQHKLLSADELMEWLARHDIALDEWKGEMRRSLLDPAAHPSAPPPEGVERMCWIHGVCSSKLAAYAQALAEEVAVHLIEGPLTLAHEELAGLAQERDRFCRSRLSAPALAAEIEKNKLGWARFEMQCLVHRDEMVVREAALCVRLDSRELPDVAGHAGVALRDVSVLLDDAERALRTRLLAANPGELVGPLTVGGDHWLVQVVRRVPPSLDDPVVRARAAQTLSERALAVEVNRHVNWHVDL